jgi:hypothetical protein
MLSICCWVVRSATLTPSLLDATNRKWRDPHNDYRNENQTPKCWLAHLFPFLLLVYCYTYRTAKCHRCRNVHGHNPKCDNQNILIMYLSLLTLFTPTLERVCSHLCLRARRAR